MANRQGFGGFPRPTSGGTGGGGGSLELTDGTHDLTDVTKITVSGATVGGTSAAATLTAFDGLDNQYDQLSSDVALTPINTYVTVDSLTLDQGTWFVLWQGTITSTSGDARVTGKLADGGGGWNTGQVFVPAGECAVLVIAGLIPYGSGSHTLNVALASNNATASVMATTPYEGSGLSTLASNFIAFKIIP